MSEGEAKRSIPAHRQAGDSARLAHTNHAELRFDLRNKFRKEEVAVAISAIGGVDEECAPAFSRDDYKLANRMVLAQVLDQPPASSEHQRLLILTEAVQKIKNWIFPVALSFV